MGGKISPAQPKYAFTRLTPILCNENLFMQMNNFSVISPSRASWHCPLRSHLFSATVSRYANLTDIFLPANLPKHNSNHVTPPIRALKESPASSRGTASLLNQPSPLYYPTLFTIHPIVQTEESLPPWQGLWLPGLPLRRMKWNLPSS